MVNCKECKALICDKCGAHMMFIQSLRDCTNLYMCSNSSKCKRRASDNDMGGDVRYYDKSNIRG